MSISYQPYTDEDLPILQEHIMLWRSQAPDNTYCHAGDVAHRLYNGNRGLYKLSEITRIYMRVDVIVAFLLVYPRHDLMNMLVNPAFKEQYDLLLPIVHAGYQIWQNNLNNKIESDKALFIECFAKDYAQKTLLKRAGFKELEATFVLNRHELLKLPNVQLPEGFKIRQATMQDAEKLADIHNASFGSKWTADVYHDEVMSKPGYKPEDEFIVIAPDGTFVAFAKIWIDTLNKVGLFEPVGTHKAYQRKGLARNLMIHVMRYMRDSGLKEAEVCFEADNLASQALYKNMGFKPRHMIHDWAKKTEEDNQS